MSDIDPADLSLTRPSISESFDEDPSDARPSDPGLKKSDREGLPPGYRMRADAHYVETLSTRRAERVDARASGKRNDAAADDVSARDRRELREASREGTRDMRERFDRLLTQLTEDMATIESAAGLLAGETSRMARRANVDVIRAQSWRASCLLRATAIIDGTHRLQVRPRPLGFILGQLRAGFASESRLAGTTVHIQTSDWNAVVAIDEQALMAAVAGGVLATIGLLDQTDDAVIRVTATTSGNELKVVEIAQDELAVSPAVSGRFFDASWTDRPGGWAAGIGAAAAKAALEQLGGEAVFLAGERFGSVLRLSFASKS